MQFIVTPGFGSSVKSMRFFFCCSLKLAIDDISPCTRRESSMALHQWCNDLEPSAEAKVCNACMFSSVQPSWGQFHTDTTV